MKNIFCLLAVALLATSCAYNRNVRIALRLAGDNRQELVRVLKHYADDEQKLRATEFLIGNMPGHYSFIPDKIVDFKRDYDSIYFNDTLSIPQKKELLENLSAQHDFNNYVDEDVRIITADFLIQDIDRSFEIWGNEPYCQHLTFEQFCELILPYKVVELQELDDWKTDLADDYTRMYEALRDDKDYTNTQKAAVDLTGDMLYVNRVNRVDDYKGFTLHNKNTLRNVKFGTCGTYSLSAVAVMRSKGIPACFESLTQWAQEAIGHSWHTILNDNGTYMASPWNLESLPGSSFFPEKKISKVFRTTYAADPFLEEYAQNSALRLPVFNKFQKDVTDLYIGTTDLEIPVRIRGLRDKYLYLSTFNNIEWNPIALGVARGRKASFNDVGMGIAYIVLGYDGEKLVPVSEPFILHTSGELEYCKTGDTVNGVRLTRKYPRTKAAAQMEDYLIGGQVQAANKPDFSDADTLLVVENLDYPDLVKVDTTKRYQYLRYSQYAPKKHCMLAEFQVFAAGMPDEPLRGDIIADESELWRGLSAFKPIFDENWLTMYSSKRFGGWVGLDFGEPRSITSFRLVPRSDDNAIHYGDSYELKYWANGGWVSLGEQVAKERFVIYDGVPAGALLLLSNNTRGKEERIFTYENGKVRWW